MLSPERAWARIVARLTPVNHERVRRADACGRVLAEPVVATVDVPQADVSAMDGYIVAGAFEAGATRPVVGVSAAGPPPAFQLAPGEVAKIMTGAVVPVGGDRVVPVEQTDGGDATVTLHAPAVPGAHIRRRAEVVATGAPILDPGCVIHPGTVSMLASHGHGQVTVVGRPTVATLATGDEVVPADVDPGPGQLRDSNTAFLGAALASLGLEARPLGIATDARDDVQRRVADGMTSDVLLLSGGVSMGDYDFVEAVLAEQGCEILVDHVAIQPGKPLVVARHATGWVVGLPGNPASVMVTFWLFVRPLLRCLMGMKDGYGHGLVGAVLASPLPGAKARDRFLPASIDFREGRIEATPHAPRGSHDVHRYGFGSALVRIPARAVPAQAGASCQVLPLVDWAGEG